MSKYISINGKLSPDDAPIFTVQNRGFKYGDALFETIKCINGEPLFLEAHLQRLYNGMKVLEFDWNDQLLKSVIYEEIKRLLIRNRLQSGARLRITVFRNEGGFYTPSTNGISVLLETSDAVNRYELNKDGLSLGVFEDLQKSIHPLSSLKSANALIYVKAGLAKTRAQVDDLIILNNKGLVCETISSNIFMVIHNRLVTPPLTEGCLPGIMRKNVLSIASSLGIEVLETPVGINALDQAEEVFTTNSITGARWIKGYGQKRYFHKISERIIEELNRATETS